MRHMSLFARSDLMSVSIPATSGGCGKTHSRPVTKGIIAKVWKLDCPPCESYLRGDNKPKVIRVRGGDKNKGIPSRMDHVADCDPHWASAPEAVPQTPDEEQIHTVRAELGEKQLKMLEAFAAAVKAGLEIPPDAMFVLEQNFDPKILKGKVVCVNGHEVNAGAKFCPDCAADMSVRNAVSAGDDERLGNLHVSTLKKMCRAQDLPDHGTKAELIERLT